MKKLFAILVCLAMVLSLAACGNDPTPSTPPTTEPTSEPTTEPTAEPTTEPTTEPPLTVEQVYADVQAAMLNAEATRMRMDLGFGVSYSIGEGEDAVTTAIEYNMLVDTIVSKDPFGSYATSSVVFNTDGLNMDVTVDVYMVPENGTVVTYMQTLGYWSRVDSGVTVEDFLVSDEMTDISTTEVWSGDSMPADMTLDPFTQILDGTEVYILRCSIPADSLADSLVEMGVELEDEADTIAMPVTYYVDTQNFTILRMDADMTVLTELMSAAMAESLLGSDAEAGDVTMEISTAVYDLDYGPQEIPTLPQEALDQTYVEPILPVEGYATDLGNGSFILPCGTEAITITCPAGWSGEVYDVNNVWIYNDDQSLYADIYYFPGLTEEDFRDQIQMDANELKDLNIFISSGDGPAYEGYTTTMVIGEGESYCYAWTPIDEGYLLLILGDFTAEPDFETFLNEMLGQLTPYTGEFAETPPVAADLGDGNFSLPCGSETVIITCPEDFAGEVYDVNNIWIYNSDDTIYGDYFYLEGWTMEDVMSHWIQPDADTLKGENVFVSLDEGPVLEDYSTQVLLGDGMNYYYAWAPKGDGCLLLQVYDWSDGGNATELLTMLLDAITIE